MYCHTNLEFEQCFEIPSKIVDYKHEAIIATFATSLTVSRSGFKVRIACRATERLLPGLDFDREAV